MANSPPPNEEDCVDKFRPGYPRYAALLSTHSSFHNFRAFNRIRLRLLLAKQDEIAVLEQSLDDIDAAEQRDLFLGYGMIAQYRGTMSLPAASKREIDNLQNWINGTGSLDRSESSYLQYADLVNISGSGDNSAAYTESVVEECIFWLETLLARVFPDVRIGRLRVTEDDNVLLLGPGLRKICRAITVMTISLVILAPTIVLLSIESPAARAKTIEVFAAGASYAAVLVVFTAAK
ncbi:hypothetical protein EKO27_g8068 [Xylaria grammica]|uniref:DUF6594 domain-containing protein n=1 Tax=Xylaria grammica TaxID=363999 RepID=A0A439CYH6_9PEZI|nr:hypothetical protein EKO27_g8068 [Xylaria grammica]